MNPKPASPMQRATPSGARSILAPSASSRSADPDRLVAERLPCLATAQPAPAAISAAVVDTLNVVRPPPVPAVSSRSSRSQRTGVASSRIVRAKPSSSSSVSPFVRSAIKKPAISTSPTSPAMIRRSTAAAPSAERSCPDAMASIAAVSVGSGKEVREQLLAGVGQHRLGVELDALGGQLAMADAHKHAATVRGRLEAVGQALLVDDERVVAADLQRVVEPFVDRAAVVVDRRGLAMHRHVADHLATERLGQRLVAQAHAERGHAGLGEAAHRLDRDA